MLKYLFIGCVLLNSISIIFIGFLLLGDTAAFPGSASHSIGKAWEAFGPALVIVALVSFGVFASCLLFGQKQIAKWRSFF